MADPESLNFMKLKKWLATAGCPKDDLNKCVDKDALMVLLPQWKEAGLAAAAGGPAVSRCRNRTTVTALQVIHTVSDVSRGVAAAPPESSHRASQGANAEKTCGRDAGGTQSGGGSRAIESDEHVEGKGALRPSSE